MRRRSDDWARPAPLLGNGDAKCLALAGHIAGLSPSEFFFSVNHLTSLEPTLSYLPSVGGGWSTYGSVFGRTVLELSKPKAYRSERTFVMLAQQLKNARRQSTPAHLKALNAQIASLERIVLTLQSEVNTVRDGLAAVQASNVQALDPFVSVDPNPEIGVAGPHITFSGANIHIVSGSGTTDDGGTPLGLGNLIIGYDEDPGPGSPLNPGDRGGSHNLVIGRFHRFTLAAFGGLVAGETNTISNTAASVSGGDSNIASGSVASVSGGGFNIASGTLASVSGGRHNTASGPEASVSGGWTNTASGTFASASGGQSNTADGFFANVSGGRHNIAIGDNCSVSGGRHNTAIGDNCSVSGGQNNTASGDNCSVSGGQNNTASGALASVSGGQKNTANGDSSSVSGGNNNLATGIAASSVSGGSTNVASGVAASVSGGRFNTAHGEDASVSGGRNNNANGQDAVVLGGHNNTASTLDSISPSPPFS
jgi:hypothetical protein